MKYKLRVYWRFFKGRKYRREQEARDHIAWAESLLTEEQLARKRLAGDSGVSREMLKEIEVWEPEDDS